MADYDDFFFIKTDANGDRLVIHTNIKITDDHLVRAGEIEGVEYVWTGSHLLGIIGKNPIKPMLVAKVLINCFSFSRWFISGDLAREVRNQCYAVQRARYEKHRSEAVLARDGDQVLKYHALLEELLENESVIRLV